MTKYKYYSSFNYANDGLSFHRVNMTTGRIEWRPQDYDHWLVSMISTFHSIEAWCESGHDGFMRCTKKQGERVVNF